MFTGLIQAIGQITAVRPRHDGRGVRLHVEPRGWDMPFAMGESIAVAGVCLTLAEESGQGRLCFDVVPETLQKTTLGKATVGSKVNLERSLAAGELVGGHFLQGHIEGMGTVESATPGADHRVRIVVPAELMPAIVPKGSIAVDGVSLTIACADAAACAFEVALIPTTLMYTTLSGLHAGHQVNLETDILARTVVNYLKHHKG